jgi:hypothetical protein
LLANTPQKSRRAHVRLRDGTTAYKVLFDALGEQSQGDLEAEGDGRRGRAIRRLRAPATMNDEGLADIEAANPFPLPRHHPGIGLG